VDPYRSCLSVPATDAAKIAKALISDADQIVLDLEDAVVAGAKDRARADLAARLAELDVSRPGLAVRVNQVGTPWCHQDILALAGAGPASLVVPKADGPGDVAFVDRLLMGMEAIAGSERRIGIQVLIETPEALHRVDDIAAASPRIESLILGYADLGAALGRSYRNVDAWLPVQHAVVLAARRHGLQAIDGPYLAFADEDGAAAANRRARDVGFDGKWVIHPRQIGPVNEAFTPSTDEVERARALRSAMESAHRAGVGASAVDGEMVDQAVLAGALRTLARAAAGRRP
jgi:citrate lyase subunit beta/citryl-CoA lyase